MKRIAYNDMYKNELTHPWYLSTRNLMYQYIKEKLARKAKILDAGCGTGGTIKFLENREPGWIVYGVDKSTIALTYCRKRGIKRLKKSGIDKMPYEDNFFDAVICLDVLYHKDVDLRKALREFYRVLKPNGLLYQQEPAYNWLKSKHDYVIETERRFTKVELKSLVKKSKFKLIKCSHFNMFLLPMIVVKRLKDRYSPKPSHSDVQELSSFFNYLMRKTLLIEAALIRIFDFPIGLSIILLSQK